MQDEKEREIEAVRGACVAQDLDALERAVKAIEDRARRSADQDLVRVIRIAVDEIARSPLVEAARGRAAIVALSTQAVTLADDAHLDAAMYLLTTWLRVDDRAAVLDQRKWAEVRRASARLWLGVWQRLDGAIDPTWNEADPANEVAPFQPPPGAVFPPSGAPPAVVPDEKVRAAYEAHLKHNQEVARRNLVQRKARRLTVDYRDEVAGYLAAMYTMPPRAEEELRQELAVVQDEKLRTKVLRAVSAHE
ncbi:hypothetical protein [Sorangium sp. So ce341]|uniref:hypothetical protein n=1 Tax=Sorangium sp. So ce341 TaxID=3133302 RepID=UPI003F5FDE7A